MCAGGVLRPKFVCGPATKRSATRLPISFGELPEGHLVNLCVSAPDGAAIMAISTRSKNTSAACAAVLDTAFILFIRIGSCFQILELGSPTGCFIEAPTDFLAV